VCEGPILGDRDQILQQKSGTSMSAPIVAGSALLVRQYFEEGWYPTGSQRVVDTHKAAASLVKAVLIHASTLQSDADSPMSTGFGSLDHLSSVLYFASGSHRLLARAPGLGARRLVAKDEQRECIVVNQKPTTTASLKATLTWTDKEGAMMSGVNIVNDLDLIIYGPPPFEYSLPKPARSMALRPSQSKQQRNSDSCVAAAASCGAGTCSSIAAACLTG
jgi:hypothetical protein